MATITGTPGNDHTLLSGNDLISTISADQTYASVSKDSLDGRADIDLLIREEGSDQFKAGSELMHLLVNYQLMPQFLQERIIDRAIISISCTPEETAAAYQQFYHQLGLADLDQQQIWRSYYGLAQEQVEQLATRKLRLEKFKQANWGIKLNSDFIKHKQRFDQVVFSLLRTEQQGLANELYFRISEGEQSFAELARAHAQGSEAATDGIVGPVELGKLHPHLAKLLSVSQVGMIQPPVCLGEFYLLVRLEKLIPARLDAAMGQRLLQLNFAAWLQEQFQQLPERERVWMSTAMPNQI
jgi:PPIC-type PPIASE domain